MKGKRWGWVREDEPRVFHVMVTGRVNLTRHCHGSEESEERPIT